MNNICDENCLVAACCSQKCDKAAYQIAKNLQETQRNFKKTYHILTDDKICPVCDKTYFYFKQTPMLHHDSMTIECTFCGSNFNFQLEKGKDKSYHLIGIGGTQGGLINDSPIFSMDKIDNLRDERLQKFFKF